MNGLTNTKISPATFTGYGGLTLFLCCKNKSTTYYAITIFILDL